MQNIFSEAQIKVHEVIILVRIEQQLLEYGWLKLFSVSYLYG